MAWWLGGGTIGSIGGGLSWIAIFTERNEGETGSKPLAEETRGSLEGEVMSLRVLAFFSFPKITFGS